MSKGFARPDLYAAWEWGTLPVVRKQTVPGAPSFLRGLRVLYASDFHLRKHISDRRVDMLIDEIGEQNADMILLGGDFAESGDQTPRMFRAISRLKPRLGMYACVGNNDRECCPDESVLRAAASSAGVRLLINEGANVELPGGVIAVAGTDERKYGLPDARRLYEGTDGQAYRILLSHYPCALNADGSFGANCVLCGHTHGGQWNGLGITPYVLPWADDRDIFRSMVFVSGARVRRGEFVLVSKGVGCSRIPLRIGVRPEIHLLEFAESR